MALVEFINESLLNLNLTIIISLITLILLLFRLTFKPKNNEPPLVAGSIPLLGHLYLFTNQWHLKLYEWHKKYGPIYRINFGRKSAVILGDFKDIKETLKMEGMTARLPAMFKIAPEFKTAIEVNGKDWVGHRKFLSVALRGSGREQPNENIIKEEIEHLLESLNARDLSKDIDLGATVAHTADNIIFKLICGKRYDDNHPMTKFIENLKEDNLFYLSMKGLSSCVGFPNQITSILSPRFRKGLNDIRKMDAIIKKEFDLNEKIIDTSNPKHYIDLAIIEMEKSEEFRKIHKKEDLIGNAQLLLLAGTETIGEALEWIILFAAKYQNLQEKMYLEISEKIGDRKPIWEDRHNVPYTEAFILECLRTKLSPLNLARCAPRDITINGYQVPEGTLVIANFLAVHKDPNLWTDPEIFNPTRFLSEDGQRVIVPEFFIVFSLGNRNCVGDKLAKMEMFLIVTSLIQQFKILPPIGGVSLEEVFIMSVHAVNPIVRLERRNRS